MEGGVLDEPIAEAKEVVIEQRHGTLKEQAWDGRVLVQMDTDEAEDTFAHQFAGDGAKKDERKPGVWVDLSRHVYYFPEAISDFSQGRDDRRRKAGGEKVPPESESNTTPQQLASELKHGKGFSSDSVGDGPGASSAS